MVKTKTALMTSLISALIVAGVYYFAHQIFTPNSIISISLSEVVSKVGITVFVTTFLVAFIGMKYKDWMKK